MATHRQVPHAVAMAAALAGIDVHRFRYYTVQELAATPAGSMDAVFMDGEGYWCAPGVVEARDAVGAEQERLERRAQELLHQQAAQAAFDEKVADMRAEADADWRR